MGKSCFESVKLSCKVGINAIINIRKCVKKYVSHLHARLRQTTKLINTVDYISARTQLASNARDDESARITSVRKLVATGS